MDALSTSVLPHLINGVSFGALLFLVAAGLTLTFGLMNTLNLAHGGFYVLGGYFALDLLLRLDNYWVAAGLAILIVGVLGIVFERLLLHRFLGPDNHLTQIVLTIGMLFFIGDQILARYGGRTFFPPRPPRLDGVLQVSGMSISWFRIALIVVALFVGLGLILLVKKTMLGAMVRASVDDEKMAEAVGINVAVLFMLAFGFGAALAAFAGVWGGAFTGLAPGIEFRVLVLAVVVIVVGGLGSIPGAGLAAVIVGLLDSFGRAYFPEYALFTMYLPVVVILAIRPQGLFGQEGIA